MEKFIADEMVIKVVDYLSRTFKVLVPTDGCLNFVPYQKDVIVDFTSMTKWGLKPLFFPQNDILFKYEAEPPRLMECLPEVGCNLIFGSRPCDARGLNLLNQYYTDPKGYPDPYFQIRYKNTLIITLACREVKRTCFCWQVGGAPDDATGSDVMLYPVQGGYLAKAYTERGQELLVDIPFTQGCSSNIVWVAPIPEGEAWQINTTATDLINRFASKKWAQWSAPCLSCNICTFFCPTCRCFTQVEEQIQQGSQRLRCWDSCMSEEYTLEASGHHPRKWGYQRYRNRVNCKFSYLPERYESLYCVGCGRCISNCPAGVDIKEVLERVLDENGK